MAVSAFKSTSKRGNLAAPSSSSSSAASSSRTFQAEDARKKIPSRRSRSVSVVSRIRQESPAPVSTLEFLNKRDNPLFCTNSSASPTDSEKSMVVMAERSGNDDIVSDGRRGRSVSRSSGFHGQYSGPRKDWGRSLSRVDTGRGWRSVSRGHCGNSESDIEEDEGHSLASTLRSRGPSGSDLDGRKINNSTHDSALAKHTRKLQTWTSRHPSAEPRDRSSTLNWEDQISTSSFSEAEEKTIKAVCEQMKSSHSDHPLSDAGGGIYETVRSEVRRAVSEIRNDLENAILRKDSSVITMANTADSSPDLVNPDAIELVSDIRKEYSIKLDQSQERARKLRAELDMEEQRGQELNRILKEMLPDPKCSGTQKSHPKRKTSIERRRMSRRLAEEAMNYFDECVSISTFDSSDFSSPEDPQPSSVGVTPPMSSIRFSTNDGSSSSAALIPNGSLNHQEGFGSQNQHSLCYAASDFTSTGGSKKPEKSPDNLVVFDAMPSGNHQFSVACEPKEALGTHDIRHYVKKFGKQLQRDGKEHTNVRSSYNIDDYTWTMSTESLLFEKLILRNRIDFGGLVVCDVRIF